MIDPIDPARANALLATLGSNLRVAPGGRLPPFFHQLYFWEPIGPAQLGVDGHPARGTGLIPDLGLARRMWAGGRLEWPGALRAGEPAEKRSEVIRQEVKEGRTGRLGFVTLRHEVVQAGAVAVVEEQDLVYRDLDAPSPMLRRAPEDQEAEVRVFGPTELFRYSALTFNGHRIHYDADYARDVEGYPGLVVHGPLLAQVLMLKAEAELGPLSGFRYRATAPVIAGEEVAFCRSGPTLWVRGQDGRLCMDATAEVNDR